MIDALKALAALILLASLTACEAPAVITEGTQPRPYPYDAAILDPLDVQVFRDGNSIELINHTVTPLHDFDLWLNERFVRRIDALPPGASIQLPLNEFVDEFGNKFRGGGFFASDQPVPVVKAEIQTPEGMRGLIVIPPRDA